MAISTGMGFDLASALEQAKKLDKYMDKWAEKSAEISANMHAAMSAKGNNNLQGFTDALANASKYVHELSAMTLSPNVDTDSIKTLSGIMSEIIDTMMSMHDVELFDTKKVYNSAETLFDAEKSLKEINKEIQSLRRNWGKGGFEPPINPKTEKPYTKSSKAYKEAFEEYKASDAAKEYTEVQKAQLNALIEAKARAKEELEYSKMTQDEKVQYVKKKLDEVFAAEKKNINDIRKEYSQLLNQLGQIDVAKKKYDSALGIMEKTGVDIPDDIQKEYDESLNQEKAIIERKKAIEEQYFSEVYDIAEKYIVAQSKRDIDEYKRRAAEKKKHDDEVFENFLKTPEGAFALSDDAESINEQKTAIDYLIQARDNLSRSTQNYEIIVDELNNRIQKHRISIEQLTKAEENENTLQPKIRNEYMRLLNELEKLRDLKEKLASTDAYQGINGTTLEQQWAASADMNAIEKREQDIQNKIIQIRENAYGLLDEVDREHAAKQAEERTQILLKAEEEIAKQREKYASISSSDAMDVVSRSESTNNLKQAEKAIQELKEARAKLDEQDSNYADTLAELNREIKRQENNIDKVINKEKRHAEAVRLLNERQEKQRGTYSGSIEYSKQAKTINELNNAIKYLKTAREKENLTTKEGRKRYKELTAELNRQQEQYERLQGAIEDSGQSLLNTGEQIKSSIATIFSISQIKGYIQSMMDVRGEFELQHKSLQVLLQDADKANELWNKTVALAVKSPFRVKQLVTYTKQLAAYRVEADKLYDTTRMLADVSAGLGVEMDRLILAYGQVKAANYLRGTELRQFSEAGVNILGELADKLSEVRNRSVSVGEVFEMVSKRMISFKDVDDIFQKITSDGGLFYQMQEKQSETLKGMIMNLRDSIDLMLEDMGQAIDSPMKNLMSLAKDFVDNWRKMIPIVSAIGTAISVNLIGKGLVKFIKFIGIAITSVKNLGRASLVATSANPWILLTSVILGVVSAITAAKAAANELSASMREVEGNITKQLRESIDTYRKLATSINDVTNTERERNKALENLKSRYAEILPDMMLERDYIEQIGNNFEEAKNALMSYYNAKARQQKADRVEQIYAENIDKKIRKIQIAVQKDITSAYSGRGNDRIREIILSSSNSIVNEVTQAALDGLIPLEDIYDAISERIATFAGIEKDTVKLALSVKSRFKIGDFEKLAEERENALKGITGMPYQTYDEAMAAKWINSETSNVEKIKNVYSQLITEYAKYASADQKLKDEIDDNAKKTIERLPGTLSAYIPYLEEAINTLREKTKDGSFEFGISIQEMHSDFLAGLTNIILASAQESEGLTTDTAHKIVNNFTEEINKESRKMKLGDFQNSIIQGMREVAGATGVSVDEFTDYIPKMDESLSDVKARIETEINEITTAIENWNNSLKSNIDEANDIRPGFMLTSPEEIDRLEKHLLPALQLLNQLFGAAMKETSKKSGDSRFDELKRIIEVIKEMNREYVKLNKTFSATESKQKVLSSYADTVKALGLDISKMEFTTLEGTAASLERVLGDPKYSASKYAIEIQRALDQVKAEIGLTVKEKDIQTIFDEIQDIFDNYSLGKDLKGMGFSSGLMQKLFGIEYVDLQGLRKSVIDTFVEASTEGSERLNYELNKGLRDINWDVIQEILGESQMDEIKKRLEEIGSLADKEYRDNAEKYLEYARKTIGERAKIKIEELTKIKEINETFAIKEEDDSETKAIKQSIKQEALLKAKAEAEESINKLNWEEFQKSDMFVSLFKDLDNASTAMLNHTMAQLQSFKEQWKNMRLEDVREIINKINEIEIQIAERNPFQSYYESVQNLKQMMESTTFESPIASSMATSGTSSDFFKALEVENIYQEQKRLNAEEEMQRIETVLRVKQGIATEEESILVSQDKYNSYLGKSSDVLNFELAIQKRISQTSQKTLGQNQKILSERQKQQRALMAQADALDKIQGMASDLFNAFKDLSDVLGGDDNPAAVFADMGMNVMTSVMSTISLQKELNAASIGAEGFGKALNTAMGIVGWIVMGVQTVSKVIKAIFDYKDKKKQKEIDGLTLQIEKLQDRYDELSESIDKAWDLSSMQMYGNQLAKTQKQMIETQKQKVALLADDKKVKKNKTNTDEYKEYEEALETLKEMQDSYTESVENTFSTLTDGILNSVDAARAFTDTWHEAFLETGDGLSGLEEDFDGMLKNILRQQATLQITSLFAQRWKDSLEKYVNMNDMRLTQEEANKWAEEVRETLPALSEALENYLGAFDFSSSGNNGLTGLQKGIQGITEDTAEIIASYLNSIRAFVATQTENLTILVSKFDITNSENPMISHLKGILTQTTAINQLLNSLVKSGHSKGGLGIKVFMD